MCYFEWHWAVVLTKWFWNNLLHTGNILNNVSWSKSYLKSWLAFVLKVNCPTLSSMSAKSAQVFSLFHASLNPKNKLITGLTNKRISLNPPLHGMYNLINTNVFQKKAQFGSKGNFQGFTKNNMKQDGPSLESSSYLNVSLRYLGPWDLRTPGPWNPLTLGLLDLFPPPTPPHTSPYILFPSPISSS